jgi:hypothetical protein
VAFALGVLLAKSIECVYEIRHLEAVDVETAPASADLCEELARLRVVRQADSRYAEGSRHEDGVETPGDDVRAAGDRRD